MEPEQWREKAEKYRKLAASRRKKAIAFRDRAQKLLNANKKLKLELEGRPQSDPGELQSRLAESEAACQKLSEDLESLRRNREIELEELDENQRNLRKRVAAQGTRLTNLTLENRELVQRLEETEQQLQGLQEQCELDRDELVESENDWLLLSERLERSHVYTRELEARLKTLESSQPTEPKGDLRKLQEKCQALSDSLAIADEELGFAQAELKETKSALAQSQADLAESVRFLEAQIAATERADERGDTVEQGLWKAQDEVRLLKAELEKLGGHLLAD